MNGGEYLDCLDTYPVTFVIEHIVEDVLDLLTEETAPGTELVNELQCLHSDLELFIFQ